MDNTIFKTITFSVLLLLSLVISISAENWPRWMNDNQNDGYNRVNGLSPLCQLWCSSDSEISNITPRGAERGIVALDDRLYVFDCENQKVICVDQITGATIWAVSLSSQFATGASCSSLCRDPFVGKMVGTTINPEDGTNIPNLYLAIGITDSLGNPLGIQIFRIKDNGTSATISSNAITEIDTSYTPPTYLSILTPNSVTPLLINNNPITNAGRNNGNGLYFISSNGSLYQINLSTLGLVAPPAYGGGPALSMRNNIISSDLTNQWVFFGTLNDNLYAENINFTTPLISTNIGHSICSPITVLGYFLYFVGDDDPSNGGGDTIYKYFFDPIIRTFSLIWALNVSSLGIYPTYITLNDSSGTIYLYVNGNIASTNINVIKDNGNSASVITPSRPGIPAWSALPATAANNFIYAQGSDGILYVMNLSGNIINTIAFASQWRHWDKGNVVVANNKVFLLSGATYDIYCDGVQNGILCAYEQCPPSPTYTYTYTSTPTDTPTSTPTDTPTNTQTDTPTSTPTWTPTSTPTWTPTATPTSSPTDTSTLTYTYTVTDTYTYTQTATPTYTSTSTPTITETFTDTPTSTDTPTYTYTPTPTNTPIVTPSITAISIKDSAIDWLHTMQMLTPVYPAQVDGAWGFTNNQWGPNPGYVIPPPISAANCQTNGENTSWTAEVGVTGLAVLALLNEGAYYYFTTIPPAANTTPVIGLSVNDPAVLRGIGYILSNVQITNVFPDGSAEGPITDRKVPTVEGVTDVYDTSGALVALAAFRRVARNTGLWGNIAHFQAIDSDLPNDFFDRIEKAMFQGWRYLMNVQMIELGTSLNTSREIDLFGTGTFTETTCFYGGWGYPIINWADMSNTQFAVWALEVLDTETRTYPSSGGIVPDAEAAPLTASVPYTTLEFYQPRRDKAHIFISRDNQAYLNYILSQNWPLFSAMPTPVPGPEGGYYGPCAGQYTIHTQNPPYGSITAAGIWSQYCVNYPWTPNLPVESKCFRPCRVG